MSFHPDQLPNLAGKVYIVTGGNSGIGYYTVSHLAAHGAHVHLCARSLEKGNAAIAAIKKEHPDANITLLQIDFADLASVVAAAKRFLTLESSLHCLINNAGIMATPYSMTADGHEIQWQTNYLAHWVLTTHLLPLLRQTAKTLSPGSVRIVNLASAGHLGAPDCGINFADTAMAEEKALTRYGQSKLANVLHAKVLHKMYGPGSQPAKNGEGEIWTTVIHPGLVSTNLAHDLASDAKHITWLGKVGRATGLMWSPDKGSWNSLFCAASPDMKSEQSGKYMEIYGRCLEITRESDAAKDEKLADKLEEWTAELMQREGWVS